MKTKVNILSPGRFHVCDLARELDKNGFDVKFYSFVPSKRTKKFGLPYHCNSSLFIIMIPFLIIEKIIFKKKVWAKSFRILVQDFITGLYMRKCDILISMSGDFLYAVKKAKNNGSKIILERGSKHILEQKKVLEEILSLKNKTPIPNINIKRELAGYQLADYISIASLHVKRSFENQNFQMNKIFINPYGVDLSMFKPLNNVKKEFDIIMVGGWSYRKGCDLLTKAIQQSKYTFLHVGGIVDLTFPEHERMTHIDPVDQTELIRYYNKAKIFVLPSREEGLAMVQAQAIACNLPLVGSPDSGAEDLKSMVEYPEFITIIKDYSVASVIKAIDNSMASYTNLKERTYAGKCIENLTWKSYGKRYTAFLNSIIK